MRTSSRAQLLCLLLVVACKSSSQEAPSASSPGPESVAEPDDAPVAAGSTKIPAGPAMLGSESSPEASAYVSCGANIADPDAVLDLASERYRSGSFAEAAACAGVATDLIPQAVEAQHLRAAALTALARYDEAQVAFAMALALDPDDPETLADVADFYINILPPKRRQTIQVGLEYARRGGERAVARRRLDKSLRARLLLLEAEALNDLSSSDLALPRVEEAISLDPELSGAEHELAVSLFNLLRFEESERAFLNVLSRVPDDPYAHHHLGLLYERMRRRDDAEAHFQRARKLAPDEFLAPVILSPEEFRAEVEEAIAELPPKLASLMSQVELELADVPQTEDLRAASPPFTPTILGLFRGLPVGLSAGSGPGSEEVFPRAVVLYRKNLGRAVRSRAELDLQIRRTLRHEVGHLQGYDEDELRRRGLE